MVDFLRSAKKAIAGGLAALGAAIGITWSELDWRELLIAFVVGVIGVYFAPRNVQPVEAPSDNFGQ